MFIFILMMGYNVDSLSCDIEWLLKHVAVTVNDWEKNRKTFFDFLSPGVGINVSLFRLGRFGEVGSELGSPEAGVEIGTG